MSTFESTVTVVAIEVALLLLAVMGVLWFLKHRSHRQELTAMQRLVAEVKAGDPARQEQIKTFLEERLGLDEERVPEVVSALVQQESAFYRYLVRAYLGRDHEALNRLPQNLWAVLAGYQELLGGEVADRAALAEAVAERDRLRSENEELVREREVLAADKAQKDEQLAITLNTVNQMLDEYSNLFASKDLPTKRLPSDSVLERVLSSIDIETKGDGE